jgi:hypothetical protein
MSLWARLAGAITGDDGLVEPSALGERVLEALLPGERPVLAAIGVRDGFLLTTHRLMATDRQGITGSKTAVTSIPWDSVTAWTLETGGTVELDEEVVVHHRAGSLTMSFRRGTQAARLVQQAIAEAVLGEQGPRLEPKPGA